MKKLLWLLALLIVSQQGFAKELIDEDPNGDKHYILKVQKVDDGKIYVLRETVYSEPDENGVSLHGEDGYFNCLDQYQEISSKHLNKSGKLIYSNRSENRSWYSINRGSIIDKIQNYVCSR